MRHFLSLLFLLPLTAGALLLFSCNDDDEYVIVYPDKGEFCMIHTNLLGEITAMTNDDDEYLLFTEALTAYNWDTAPLSSYRAYVLYCYTDDPAYVSFYDGTLVEVCTPVSPEEYPDGLPADAVFGVADVSLAHNCNYINLVVAVYPSSAVADHVWGCVKEVDEETGRTTLTITHEQLTVASYYSTVYAYLSIPVVGYLSSFATVDVVVPTVSGDATTTLTIPDLSLY